MQIPPPMFSVEERVAMATRCRDADPVPKVAEAGMVFTASDGERFQIMHNGLRVIADGYYGAWMTDLIRLCRGHHEPQEERLFHEVVSRLPSHATMVELGGFWAYYSLWFLKDRIDRRAVVVEPEPTHLAIGRRNAALNGLSPSFHAGFAGSEFAEKLPFETEVSGVVELPRFSVPYLMDVHGWAHLDVLHCDIQGAETEVLESCREFFRNRRIDWVFVSTHAHQISGDALTHHRCLSLLRDCGATIVAEHDAHESFSGDGLIVARFCPAPPDWPAVALSCNRQSQSLFRHLSYDLHEVLAENAALRAKLHGEPSAALRRTATVYELQCDGPLGGAGERLLLPSDQVMTPTIETAAAWSLDEVTAFVAKLDAEKTYTLIDIGANIGLFTRQAVNLSGCIRRALCVEPDPENFRALRFNADYVGAEVEVFRLALGAVDGQQTFYRDAENYGNYSLNSDAMRDRPFACTTVDVRRASDWLASTLASTSALAWKSDTQGFDELIVSQAPREIWERIDVALVELWRIDKPEFDRTAFLERIESFPNRRLGEQDGVSVARVEEYLAGDDWQFQDLLMWR